LTKQVKYFDFSMFFPRYIPLITAPFTSDATFNQSNYQEMRNIYKNENFQRKLKQKKINMKEI